VILRQTELSLSTFRTFLRDFSSRRATPGLVLEELMRSQESADHRPDAVPPRPQRRYDHRLRDLVQRTRDVTIATDLGVPRSTGRGWIGKAPNVVVSLDVTDLTA
jgi:hypothetical protein